MQNGQLDDEVEATETSVIRNEDAFDEEEPLSLTPNDIIGGFDHPIDQKDNMEGEMLLKATAEMLIKSTIYPASFDRWKQRLERTINAWPPKIDSLTNLAEMLIYWVRCY